MKLMRETKMSCVRGQGGRSIQRIVISWRGSASGTERAVLASKTTPSGNAAAIGSEQRHTLLINRSCKSPWNAGRCCPLGWKRDLSDSEIIRSPSLSHCNLQLDGYFHKGPLCTRMNQDRAFEEIPGCHIPLLDVAELASQTRGLRIIRQTWGKKPLFYTNETPIMTQTSPETKTS
jgi:hypothetical protein